MEGEEREVEIVKEGGRKKGRREEREVEIVKEGGRKKGRREEREEWKSGM